MITFLNILLLCMAFSLQATAQPISDSFLQKLIDTNKEKRLSFEKARASVNRRIQLEIKTSNFNGLSEAVLTLAILATQSLQTEAIREIENQYLKFEKGKDVIHLALRPIVRVLRDYYFENKLSGDYIELFKKIETWLYQEGKTLTISPKVSYSNQVELGLELLDYYIHEQYLGPPMRWLAQQNALFNNYEWVSKDNLKLRLAVRAKFFRYLGQYDLASQHLAQAKAVSLPAESSASSICFTADEELELLYARGEFTKTERGARAQARSKFAGLNSPHCQFSFIDLLISSLLSQGKVQKVGKFIEALQKLNPIMAEFASLKFHRQLGKKEETFASLKKVTNLLESSPAKATLTNVSYYLNRDKMITAVYLKDKKLFSEASTGVQEALKRRRDNTYYEPLVQAWQTLGKAAVLEQPFDAKLFASQVKTYADRYGARFPDVVEIESIKKKLYPTP